jgi:hypothetical protein
VSIPREQVDMRKQFNGILGLFSDHGGLAQIALLLQSLIARPAIGVKGAAGLPCIRAERVEASGGSIRNRTQPDSAYAFTLHLYRDDYQRLIASTTTAHACGSDQFWPQRITLLQCVRCDYQSSVIAGTLLQDTHTPLTLWFGAIWYVTSQKNGASALGVQRILGLGSYRTAWAWLHKLRRAMVRLGRDRLQGRVEVDETLVGGEEDAGDNESRSASAATSDNRGRPRR